jgi:hypothetical protein
MPCRHAIIFAFIFISHFGAMPLIDYADAAIVCHAVAIFRRLSPAHDADADARCFRHTIVYFHVF